MRFSVTKTAYYTPWKEWSDSCYVGKNLSLREAVDTLRATYGIQDSITVAVDSLTYNITGATDPNDKYETRTLTFPHTLTPSSRTRLIHLLDRI